MYISPHYKTNFKTKFYWPITRIKNTQTFDKTNLEVQTRTLAME